MCYFARAERSEVAAPHRRPLPQLHQLRPLSATGKLYVSNGGASSILRFDAALTASGNIIPSATISGANTTLNAPAFITLDVAADRLYVANTGDLSIVIFDSISTKTGNVAPERTIAGSLTTLIEPHDVSLDKGQQPALCGRRH